MLHFSLCCKISCDRLYESVGPTELPLSFGEEVQCGCLVLQPLAEIRILVPSTRDSGSGSIPILAPVFNLEFINFIIIKVNQMFGVKLEHMIGDFVHREKKR